MNSDEKGQLIALMAILVVVAVGALEVAVGPVIEIIKAVQGR